MGTRSATAKDTVRVPDIVEQPCGLYPGSETFSPEYDADDYRDWVDQSNGDPLPAPLVLYLQNRASPDGDTDSEPTVRAMEQELRLQGALFDTDRPLKQLIWTGSMVSDWSDEQLSQLVAVIRDSFYINHDSLDNWCVCSSDMVPSADRLHLLQMLGFTHLRLAPQTSGAETLPVEQLSRALRGAKQKGFRTTILDLRQVYAGRVTLQHALNALLTNVQPDRIRVLPAKEDPVSGDFLASFGYQDIGLGWYLRTGDSWWHARNSGRLYWTLLGFGELQSPDVIGVGPGALSAVGDFYAISDASQAAYAESLEALRLPVVQGVVLEDAEVLRREIIAMILTSASIRITAIENKWGIRFDRFFRCESELLRAFERNRWIRWQGERIEIRTRACRELLQICGVFDGRNGNPLTHVPHYSGRPVAGTQAPTAAFK